MPQIECPDQQTLSQWIDGLLPLDQAEAHERHFESCEVCQESASRLNPFDSLSETLAAGETISGDSETDLNSLIRRIQGFSGDEGQPGSFDLDVRSFLQPPEKDDELGRLGDHRVLEFLGTGGMGIVFKAEDTRLQRTVALKVMHPLLSTSRHASRRFMREARATAAFEHEHIVTIYNVGEDHGLSWLSMNLLEGESLHDRLQRTDTLPIGEATRIAREIAVGLAAAHEHGLLHRDIKPDNIWLRAGDDRVTILDFGLARVADQDSLVTRAGAVLGTPDYMAPEQARGEEVDVRCDLFSLGCVLYRMLTGASPFSRGNVLATLHALTLDEVVPAGDRNADVPPGLSRLIDELLSRDPAGRPATAQAVVDRIDEISTEAKRPAGEQPAPASRPRTNLVAVCGIILGLIAGFIIQWTTDKGTLTVDVRDDKLAVLLESDSLTVRDRQSGDEITLRIGENRLPSGEYEILARAKDSRLELSMTEFALVRSSEKRLTIAWKKDGGETETAGETEQVVSETEMPTSQTARSTINWNQRANRPLERSGKPLTERALVQNPTPIGGVASWSVEPRAPLDYVHEIAMRPDGKLVATTGDDGMIRLWDASTGALQHIIPAHDRHIYKLAWSNDGKVLASCEFEGEIRIWRIPGPGLPIRLVQRIQRSARDLAFSPDDSILAFTDDETRFWSLAEKRVIPRGSIKGRMTEHPWSPDGKLFLTGESQRVQIWDFGLLRPIETIPNVNRVAGWAPEGHRLAVLSLTQRNQTLEPVIDIWDIDRLERTFSYNLGSEPDLLAWQTRASWSPDGMLFLVSRVYGDNEKNKESRRRLDLFDAIDIMRHSQSPKQTALMEGERHDWHPGSGFSWSKDARRLAIYFFDKTLIIEPEAARTLQFGMSERNKLSREGFWRDQLVGFADATDLHTFGEFELWDLATLKHKLTIHDKSIVEMQLDPTGKLIASVHQLNDTDFYELRLTSVPDGKLLGTMPLSGFERFALNWSPGGSKLAVLHGGLHQLVEVPLLLMVDAGNARILHEVNTRPQGRLIIPLFCWSPDGTQYLLRRGRDVERIDAVTGHGLQTLLPTDLRQNEDGRQPPRQMTGFGGVDSVAWSPDGKTIVLGYNKQQRRRVAELPSVSRRQSFNDIWGIQRWTKKDDSFAAAQIDHLVMGVRAGGVRSGHIHFAPDSKGLIFWFDETLFFRDLVKGETIQCPYTADEFSSHSRNRFSNLIALGNRSFQIQRGSRLLRWENVDPKKVTVTSIESETQFLRSGNRAARSLRNRLEFLTADGRSESSLIVNGDEAFAISSTGHVRSADGAANVVYVAVTNDGEHLTLTPDEFRQRFDWANDAQRAQFR